MLPLLYPLTTKSLPRKSVSLDGKSLEALCTNIYSVANPVALTFLADRTSLATNPPTLATLIVAAVAAIVAEPVRAVELAM